MKESVIKQQLDLLSHNTGIGFLYTNKGVKIQSNLYTDIPIINELKNNTAVINREFADANTNKVIKYQEFVNPLNKRCLYVFPVGISMGSKYVIETGVISEELFERHKPVICRTVLIIIEMFQVLERMYEVEFSSIAINRVEEKSIRIYNTVNLLKRARLTQPSFCACRVSILNDKEILNVYGSKALEGAKCELHRLLSLKAKRFKNPITTCNRVENDGVLLLLPYVKDVQSIVGETSEVLVNFTSDTYLITVKLGAVYANYPEVGDIERLSNYLSRGITYLAENSTEVLEFIDMKGKLGDKIINEFKLSEDLRHTVTESKDDILVMYQPKVDTNTGKVIGAEGLVRWQMKGRGLIPPNEFIPISERTGIIKELGKIVLDRVIEDSKRINRELEGLLDAPLRLGVNVSAVQLEDDSFVRYLEEKIKSGHCDPKLLDLEVTESVGMYDINHTIELLGRLSILGITISLDDFGTGYSSLTYMKNLPLNYLKIDKSFVDSIFEKTSFCKNIIDISKKLGLMTVAEGVETHEQWDTLKSFDCDILQGYLFSKPVPYKDLVEKVKDSYAYTL